LRARRFSQRAQLTQRQSGTCTTLDGPDTGRAWWAADGAWSACGRVERAALRQRCPPPAERDCPLQREVTATFHIHASSQQWADFSVVDLVNEVPGTGQRYTPQIHSNCTAANGSSIVALAGEARNSLDLISPTGHGRAQPPHQATRKIQYMRHPNPTTPPGIGSASQRF
jgi:hypothetical protein